jgi:hypothetical protein
MPSPALAGGRYLSPTQAGERTAQLLTSRVVATAAPTIVSLTTTMPAATAVASSAIGTAPNREFGDRK